MSEFKLAMWEVSGIKNERTHEPASFFSCLCTESGEKEIFLVERSVPENFQQEKFFGASTFGILTHSEFRKYSRFGLPSLRFEVIAAQSKVIGKKRSCYKDKRCSQNTFMFFVRSLQNE